MKRSRQCPKCDSRRVGYFSHLPDIGQSSPSSQRVIGTIPSGSVWRAEALVGTLEAYVCAACGYVETYVKDVADVPFASLDGFRWVNAEAEAEAEGPFR